MVGVLLIFVLHQNESSDKIIKFWKKSQKYLKEFNQRILLKYSYLSQSLQVRTLYETHLKRRIRIS